METELLVEDRIGDGHKFIDLLAQKEIDVTAACWVKTSEEGRWLLYIASKMVDDKGLAAAYRDILGVLLSIEPPSWISMSEVKVISPGSPLAKDVLDLYRRYPTPFATRLRVQQLGSIAIEEADIYPPPKAYFKGFGEIKKRYPSAEMVWITVANAESLLETVDPYIGKVNETVFEGKAPGTMLLVVGPQFSSPDPSARLGFVYRPEGWNTLFNPRTEQWEEVVHVETGKSFYEATDFRPLAALIRLN